MGYFRKARNVELSTIYHLETNIGTDWSGVNVVKSQHQATKSSLPVVCIRLIDNNPDFFEIGARTLQDNYGITIDIYAKSDGQRLDLADYIKSKLVEANWPYYVHSLTGETLNRAQNGLINLMNFIQDARVDFGEATEAIDRFRHSITILVKTSKLI